MPLLGTTLPVVAWTTSAPSTTWRPVKEMCASAVSWPDTQVGGTFGLPRFWFAYRFVDYFGESLKFIKKVYVKKKHFWHHAGMFKSWFLSCWFSKWYKNSVHSKSEVLKPSKKWGHGVKKKLITDIIEQIIICKYSTTIETMFNSILQFYMFWVLINWYSAFT